MKRSDSFNKTAKYLLSSWLQHETIQTRGEQGDPSKVGPYLVISREEGAGGSEIARSVGEQLGWQILDREIIDFMAEEYHTPRHLLEFVDEKTANWVTEFFTGFLSSQIITSSAFVHRLGRILLLAAQHGRTVIVGRGAQYILPRDQGLVVRVVAPLDFRVRAVMEKRGASLPEAKFIVESADKQREDFVKQYFHHDVNDPHLHDLVINVERVGQDAAVTTILSTVNAWLVARDNTP